MADKPQVVGPGWAEVPPRPPAEVAGRSIAGLLAVLGAGTGFGVLLMLVRFHWSPLDRADRGVADWLNELVSPHEPLITTLKVITSLGSWRIMIWPVSAAVVGLLIRHRYRLAGYLVVACLGTVALDPGLKLLVGRLRPVVEVPIAHAPGNSFPSGHALGSTVAYGALLLVFLPAARRTRSIAVAVVATPVVLIGLTRLALGVHYVSDVVAGWLLGLAWLGVTAYAFRLAVMRRPWVVAAELLTGFVLVVSVLFGPALLVNR